MKNLFGLLMTLLPGTLLYSQSGAEGIAASSDRQETLPLRRVALFSSGVGYYEHAGNVSGSAAAPLSFSFPFNLAAVNDVLKSLVINDPLAENPSVRYPSADTLYQTLASLSVDLSANPGLPDILNNLKGEEIEIHGPVPVRGRIIGVEIRRVTGQNNIGQDNSRLSLLTAAGLRVIPLADVSFFSFTNQAINADFNRALDLIMDSRNSDTRNLQVSLPGEGRRDVSISYVVPAPVWKVSYRLDLGATQSAGPLLQGWAIIDNDSDIDWKDVELSLVTGRPVSFIQNLYPPYHTSRPVLPLAIAGIAEGRSYDSGSAAINEEAVYEADEAIQYEKMMSMAAASPMAAPAEQPRQVNVAGGTVQTAQAAAAGDQFEFTLKNPVNLERHQSAMFPLVESPVRAEKTLVFSGERAQPGGASVNPALSAELTNTSGMRLPAGPITVYDSGTYAGDALIEFFPENEKRIISYAEDLTVQGSRSYVNSRVITAVTVSAEIMTITRRQDYTWTYTVRNAAPLAKKLIIEHPITQGTTLREPVSFYERTPTLYRFSLSLPASRELTFTVREEMPVQERVSLSQFRPENFLNYTTNQEIPANVRAALNRAVELKRSADNALVSQQESEAQRSRFISEQDRIRRNLEAAGTQSPQGQEYLNRLSSLDREIDAANQSIENAANQARAAKREYDNYLAGLNLE